MFADFLRLASSAANSGAVGIKRRAGMTTPPDALSENQDTQNRSTALRARSQRTTAGAPRNQGARSSAEACVSSTEIGCRFAPHQYGVAVQLRPPIQPPVARRSFASPVTSPQPKRKETTVNACIIRLAKPTAATPAADCRSQAEPGAGLVYSTRAFQFRGDYPNRCTQTAPAVMDARALPLRARFLGTDVSLVAVAS
jgi:hypothetical protein